MVVGPGFFKIMASFCLIYFSVAPVSAFRVIVFLEFFNTACLYAIIFGGTKVLPVDFNKISLLLFVSTFSTVPHHHYTHP